MALAIGGADFTARSVCSIDAEGAGDGAGDGGGDAAGAPGAAGGAAAAIAGAGGGEAGEDAAVAAAAAAGGDDYAWADGVAAEAPGEGKASNMEWLRTSGVKNLDNLVQVARDNQAALRESGRIKVPGEGAKPEEIAEFNKAIGVPESAEGYEFTLPEGLKPEHLDMDLVTPLRAIALGAGVPAPGFAALARGVVDHQLGELARERSEEDADYSAKEKSWGAEAPARMAEVQSGLRAVGLNATDFEAIQRGLRMQYGKPGSSKALEIFQRIGASAGEDRLLGGSGRRFGITAAEAQTKVDAAMKDPKFDPANNDTDKANWALWNKVIARERDRKAAAATAA